MYVNYINFCFYANRNESDDAPSKSAEGGNQNGGKQDTPSQKSDLKSPEISSDSANEEKKPAGNGNNSGNNNNNSNSGAQKSHQVEREGNCYW